MYSFLSRPLPPSLSQSPFLRLCLGTPSMSHIHGRAGCGPRWRLASSPWVRRPCCQGGTSMGWGRPAGAQLAAEGGSRTPSLPPPLLADGENYERERGDRPPPPYHPLVFGHLPIRACRPPPRWIWRGWCQPSPPPPWALAMRFTTTRRCVRRSTHRIASPNDPAGATGGGVQGVRGYASKAHRCTYGASLPWFPSVPRLLLFLA